MVRRVRELRALPAADVIAALAYFALIGLGFMFVEIGLLSRLNTALRQPTLGDALAGVREPEALAHAVGALVAYGLWAIDSSGLSLGANQFSGNTVGTHKLSGSSSS